MRRQGENLWHRQFILPPGWMKTYPKLGMRPLAWAAREWHRSLDRPRPLVLAVSYPHYLYLRDLLRPDGLVYYNMDDYAFYWNARREAIRRLERRTVREADVSVFCAKARADELTRIVPGSADRIVHLPHGAPSSAITDAPQHRPAIAPADIAHLPRPLLGFVGSLEDRLDWGLVERVSRDFPGGSVVLIGREPAVASRQPWYADYRRAVARPNVHRLGWKTQAQIGAYNASFDVCMIPYRTDHPFNLASCPTKVMDYMATSRPVVSTALPECRLYDHLFAVAESDGEFVSAIRRIVEAGSDDGRALMRWQAAKDATWENTSAELLRHLRERIALPS
jgi:glycosyltransferase involved in cell wall biosynthesis